MKKNIRERDREREKGWGGVGGVNLMGAMLSMYAYVIICIDQKTFFLCQSIIKLFCILLFYTILYFILYDFTALVFIFSQLSPPC
jgi:hypothetical protein